MPIRKLRNDSVIQQTLADTQSNIARSKKTMILGWFFTIFFALSVGGGILYFMLRPVSGFVIIDVPISSITSPVEGEIAKIRCPQGFTVNKGDVLFVIKAKNLDSPENNFYNRMFNAKTSAMRDLANARKSMADNEKLIIETESELKLREIACRKALIEVQKAQDTLQERSKELETAERLWNLDAIKASELQTARRTYREASATLKTSDVTLEEQNKLVEVAKEKLEKCKDVYDDLRRNLESMVKLNESASTMDNGKYAVRIKQDGDSSFTVEVCSPAAGTIDQIFVQEGIQVSDGSPLMTLASAGQSRVFAYVKAEYLNACQENTPVKVTLNGEVIKGKIAHLATKLESLPPQMKALDSSPAYWAKAELILDRPPSKISSGLTGRVVLQ